MNNKLLFAIFFTASTAQAAFAASSFNPQLTNPRTPATVLPNDVDVSTLRAPTSLTVTAGNITATARKLIVGTTSTGTAAANGNPIYHGRQPAHSGVAQMTNNFGAAGTFVCSGALLPDGIHVLTAAHCVSDGPGTPNPLTTTVRFSRDAPDTIVSSVNASTANVAVINAAAYFVHPDYTGQVIDQNDIAIIRLAEAAPDWVTRYRIATVFNLAGNQYEVAGYGRRGPDGLGGSQFGTGRLRSGENEFDFRLGDPVFGGFWELPNPNRPGSTTFFGTAALANSYLSDFDSPTGNNASCLLTNVFTGSLTSRYCNGAVGAREATTAGGDSGGPNFIGGRLAGITSFGLSFGTGFGDSDGTLNSSFGEFAGVVPVNLHRNFITSVTGFANGVPEPSSWAMLIAGFGLVGATMRRQRKAATTA